MLSDYQKSASEPEIKMSEPSPEPVEPQEGISGRGKGCLIGGIIFLILIGLTVGMGVHLVYTKSGEWISEFFEKTKPEIMKLLSPEVQDSERASFETTYDAMVKEIKEQGISSWIKKHEKSIRTLQIIMADQKISPEEIQLWTQEWNSEQHNSQK